MRSGRKVNKNICLNVSIEHKDAEMKQIDRCVSKEPVNKCIVFYLFLIRLKPFHYSNIYQSAVANYETEEKNKCYNGKICTYMITLNILLKHKYTSLTINNLKYSFR